MASRDPNNPWNQAPAAPPASGFPNDYARTPGLTHRIGRPHEFGKPVSEEGLDDLEKEFENYEPSTNAGVERPHGVPQRRVHPDGTYPVYPAEYQRAHEVGGIGAPILVNTEETNPEDVPSIKANPAEEVRVFPGVTHEDLPDQVKEQRTEEGAPVESTEEKGDEEE